LAPEVPPELEAAIARLMARERQERPADLDDCLELLDSKAA
jgi:hypothetical protein